MKLTSCRKITSNPKTFTIKKGHHRSTYALNYSKDTVFGWNIMFDSSAIYKTVDSVNQYDINKLIGWSDCGDNHMENSIRFGARNRGLYDKGDTKTQFAKLMEESGELARAVLKDDKKEFVDAIGDMVVVLTNMAHLGGTTIEKCIDTAYEVISKRTCKMVNGTFVKDEK